MTFIAVERPGVSMERLPHETIIQIETKQLDISSTMILKGIITDLDNTLVEWDRALATEEVKGWFKTVQDKVIGIMVIRPPSLRISLVPVS